MPMRTVAGGTQATPQLCAGSAAAVLLLLLQQQHHTQTTPCAHFKLAVFAQLPNQHVARVPELKLLIHTTCSTSSSCCCSSSSRSTIETQ